MPSRTASYYLCCSSSNMSKNLTNKKALFNTLFRNKRFAFNEIFIKTLQKLLYFMYQKTCVVFFLILFHTALHFYHICFAGSWKILLSTNLLFMKTLKWHFFRNLKSIFRVPDDLSLFCLPFANEIVCVKVNKALVRV